MSDEVRGGRYGEWASPLAPEDMAAKAVRLSAPRWGASGNAFWLEGRAADGGRVVLVERPFGGVARDWTPAAFSVRSRVHEYGGGAYAVRVVRVQERGAFETLFESDKPLVTALLRLDDDHLVGRSQLCRQGVEARAKQLAPAPGWDHHTHAHAGTIVVIALRYP